MKLIILAILVGFVFGDRHEAFRARKSSGHEGSKQAVEYGLPATYVNVNTLSKDANPYKPNKAITVTSSSSHSHTFKNKTSHTSSHQGFKPNGQIFNDVPHKNIVSFMSHYSTMSQFSNRTNKPNLFVPESQQKSKDNLHFDDGSYKPKLYLNLETSNVQEITKIQKTGDLISPASSNQTNGGGNLDDESYKPELYKSFDLTTDNFESPNVDDGSYKPELYKNVELTQNIDKTSQYSKNTQHLDGTISQSQSNCALNYDDGSYSKFTQNNDEYASRAHNTGASTFDNGLYKPELYTTHNQAYAQNTLASSASFFNDGSYKHEASYDAKTFKSNHHDEKASHEGLYKPEHYKTIDEEPNNGATSFDDGSYKPELYKIYSNIVSNFNGRLSNALHDRLFLKLSHDNGSYKPNFYKDGLEHRDFTDSELYKKPDHIFSDHIIERLLVKDGLYNDDRHYPQNYPTGESSGSQNSNNHANGMRTINSNQNNGLRLKHVMDHISKSNRESSNYNLNVKQHIEYGVPLVYNSNDNIKDGANVKE